MKGGHAHIGATDEDWLEDGKGCRRTGPSDVDHDVLEGRHLLLGGELVGDGPPRCLGRVAQCVLLVEGIDLHHYAVGLVGHVVAFLLGAFHIAIDVVDRLHDRARRIGAQPQSSHEVDSLRMRREGGPALHEPQLVDPDLQFPLRCDRGVLHPNTPCGCVTGIGEQGFALRGLPLVELVEGGVGHVDLSPDLEDGRHVITEQPQRDRLDGAQVRRDVLAHGAIAARGARR